MKPTIGTTPYGMSLDLKKQAMNAATFLTKNQHVLAGRDGVEYLKSSVKMTVSTPLTDIYTRAADLDKLNCFSIFDLSGVPDVPSVLTVGELTIDGKYISPNMPHVFQNAWINLTPFLKVSRNDAYNRIPQITDTIQFASLVARGLLCMSYNDSDVWLTPSLRITIIEAYSLCMTMRMKTLFDLNFEEFALCRLLFAAYMAQMLESENETSEVPPILYSCKFLFMDTGTPRTIDDRLMNVSDVRTQIAPTMKLSIDTICGILRAKGPDRMKKLLKTTAFYQFMSRSPNDSQSMLLSLDYPPYFVYKLLENMKGGKNPFFQSLIRFGDMKRTLVKFTDDLISSKMFIDKVSR